MISTPPWERSPDLLPARLKAVARILIGAAEEMRRRHKGLRNFAWGTGCGVYNLALNDLREFAGDTPWVEALGTGLNCSLMIGETLCKFYSGDPQEPGARRLRSSARDLSQAREQQQLFADTDVAQGEWCWWFVLDASGKVVLMQADLDGMTRYHWPIDLTDVKPIRHLSPVPLPSAPVSLKGESDVEDDEME